MARPILKAKKAVADPGNGAALVVPLNSGWNTTYGSATYAPADNDFIIVSRVIGTLDVDQTINITAPSGTYTTRADLYQNDSGDCNLHVATKHAVASTDTQVTIAATGSTSNEGAYEIEIWSGVDTTTPMDVAVTTAGGINGGQPNPPSITPTTADTVVIVIGAAAVLTGMVAFTQSGSELSNFLSVAQTGGTEACIGSGSFNWTSGAFDPVAWTGGSTGTGACWNAVCLALRPASGGASQNVDPGLATNSQTFHAPTVARGAVTLAPALFSDSDVFHAPTVERLAVGGKAIVNNANTTVTHLGDSVYEIEKTSGVADTYDASAVSSAGVTGDFVLRLAPVAGSANYGGGVTSDPLANDSYDTVDRLALYVPSTPEWTIFENGVQVAGGLTPSTYFWIWRIGSSLNYGRGATLGAAQASPDRTVTDSSTLYFDSSFRTVGNKIEAQFLDVGTPPVQPSLFVNSQSFHSPTVTSSATLTPSLYADPDSFHAPTVTRGPVTLTPSLYADADTFHAPAVTASKTLSPSLYTNAQTFHVPTVSRGAVTLLPPLVVDADSFHAPAVTTSYSLQAPLYVNGQVFYGPTITQAFPQELTPALFANSQTFHALHVLSSGGGGGGVTRPKVSAFFYRG